MTGVVAVAAGLTVATPSVARTAITVKVNTTKDAVVFRFAGLRPCDSVVANATVIQWLGPEVQVVVRRASTAVAHASWLACSYRKGRLWPWDARPKKSNGNWLPSGRQNVLTLAADMPTTHPTSYRFDVSVDGRRVRSGRIRVTEDAGVRRIAIT